MPEAAEPRHRAAPTAGPPEPFDALPRAGLVPHAEFRGDHEIRLLRGGDALFPAMLEAIAGAEREIWLATYIYHDDPAAHAISDALVSASTRGVAVHVVVDGFGSKASLGALQQRFDGTGVALAVFRPVHSWWAWLQPGQLRRLHQKLCVVDTAVGFVGGINIIDDRHDLNHGWTSRPRLDFAVQVRGPSVESIGQTVRAVWTRAKVGRRWGEELLAVARAPEPVRQLRRLWSTVRISERPPPAAAPGQPMLAAFVVRDNFRQRRTIERGYVEAIRKAARRVDIVCPYFYPGRMFRHALRDAARRGVSVRLLMQGRWDYRTAALAARALYAELLGRGVRILEYTPAFLHAKVALVDDDWATVGSSNIDPLSLLLNLEANVIVRDRDFTRCLEAEIEAACAESQEVTTADVDGRYALLQRAFVAACARLFLRLAGQTGRY